MKRSILLVFYSGSILAIWLIFTPAWASSPRMMDIQYWLAPDQIQTIISFDQAIAPSYHSRSDPERFVLEIPDCEYVYGNQTLPVYDATLQQIRVQRLNNGTTQVVFDLSRKIEASVHVLPQLNGQPDQIVVNLFDVVIQEQVQQEKAERYQAVQQLKYHHHHIVVLDPGHGGRDPGAVGPTGLKEKNVVLDLARMIQKIIHTKAPSITVYLTRDGDYFLPLRKRTDIAEEYNADLFISLHVNANPSRGVQGFSVYTLAENATDAAARELAEKENAADLFGGIETPTPTDDDSLLKFILADLSTTAALQHSLDFGQMSVNTVVSSLKKYQIPKEGLKRANFVVLRSADIPSILVEACYISNQREEKLLNQKDFRQDLAEALATSIIQYFADMPNSAESQWANLQTAPSMLPLSVASDSSPGQEHRVHIVKSGESLSVIAGKYNVNLTTLRQINQLASADLIYVGQKLWIP
ncbi:MAG: N-acetylmuramoyl-L-alanine amidase [Candidatus Vecturithrix sp.]|jgi:N-acetylmuramoyl-L-alanine amidase|nr:N-acetylmuramoyl-L-alanine amidase [Candidatus Vecturithrix sp.]